VLTTYKRSNSKFKPAQLLLLIMAMSTNYAPKQNCDMSLYIPRVDTRSVPSSLGTSGASFVDNIKDFIAKQFHYQQIGHVSRVDLLEKKTHDGWTFYIAFVHFDVWYETPAATEMLAAINDPGKKAKLHFHERWYWIVNENKKPLTAEVVDLHRVIREQQADIDDLTVQLSKLTSGPQPPTIPPPQPPTIPPPQPPSGFPPLTPLGSSTSAVLPPPPIKHAPMKRARTDASGFKSSQKVLFRTFADLDASIAGETESAPEGALEEGEVEDDHSTLTPTQLPLLTDMPVLSRCASVASNPRVKRSISDAKSVSMPKKQVVIWGDSDTETEEEEDLSQPELMRSVADPDAFQMVEDHEDVISGFDELALVDNTLANWDWQADSGNTSQTATGNLEETD